MSSRIFGVCPPDRRDKSLVRFEYIQYTAEAQFAKFRAIDPARFEVVACP
jgi:hypothetical protein